MAFFIVLTRPGGRKVAVNLDLVRFMEGHEGTTRLVFKEETTTVAETDGETTTATGDLVVNEPMNVIIGFWEGWART